MLIDFFTAGVNNRFGAFVIDQWVKRNIKQVVIAIISNIFARDVSWTPFTSFVRSI